MRRRRPLTTLSLSFLDAICCGFGALVLLFLILSHNTVAQRREVNEALLREVEALADIINDIQPDEVQLNTPKRAYPLEWHLDSRGNHGEKTYPTRELRVVSPPQADEIEHLLQEKTRVPILSIYKK